MGNGNCEIYSIPPKKITRNLKITWKQKGNIHIPNRHFCASTCDFPTVYQQYNIFACSKFVYKCMNFLGSFHQPRKTPTKICGRKLFWKTRSRSSQPKIAGFGWSATIFDLPNLSVQTTYQPDCNNDRWGSCQDFGFGKCRQMDGFKIKWGCSWNGWVKFRLTLYIYIYIIYMIWTIWIIMLSKLECKC